MERFMMKIKKNKDFREVKTKELLSKIEKGKAYTHAGVFHADDVMSAALLKIVNPNIVIERVYELPNDVDQYLAFDIGLGEYDHHQKDNEYRDVKRQYPYASFGKLWEVLGPVLVGKQYHNMEKEIIISMDIADNTGYQNPLSQLISAYNPLWDESQDDKDFDDAFDAVVTQMVIFLNRYIEKMKAYDRALENIPSIVENSFFIYYNNKKACVSVLDRYIPIAQNLSSTEIDFIIYPSSRGGYCVSPIKLGGRNKISIAVDLWGKIKKELDKIIPGVHFVHNNGFLAAVDSVESAKNLIRYSLGKKGNSYDTSEIEM